MLAIPSASRSVSRFLRRINSMARALSEDSRCTLASDVFEGNCLRRAGKEVGESEADGYERESSDLIDVSGSKVSLDVRSFMLRDMVSI
jgi:hypothetical protein